LLEIYFAKLFFSLSSPQILIGRFTGYHGDCLALLQGLKGSFGCIEFVKFNFLLHGGHESIVKFDGFILIYLDFAQLKCQFYEFNKCSSFLFQKIVAAIQQDCVEYLNLGCARDFNIQVAIDFQEFLHYPKGFRDQGSGDSLISFIIAK
jgi:hypothetical protein